MSNYGANSGQVARLVQRVRLLTDAQWSDIVARRAGYAAVFGTYDQHVVELDGYKTHGVDKANKILEKASVTRGSTVHIRDAGGLGWRQSSRCSIRA